MSTSGIWNVVDLTEDGILIQEPRGPGNFTRGSSRIGGVEKTPLVKRLLSRCRVDDSGCWNWTGYVGSWGYGEIGKGSRAEGIVSTHVAAYQTMVNPNIPDGYEVDHLCFNRVCCNPWHLEAVPGCVNRARANGRRWENSVPLSHCKRGHEFSEENTYVSRAGVRSCRECTRMRQRAAYWEKKQSA
jgi:hypothetical protein